MVLCRYCGRETEPELRWHERGDCESFDMIGSHGHVLLRSDRYKSLCGGPLVCMACWKELQALPSGEKVEWLKQNGWDDKMYVNAKSKFEKLLKRSISNLLLED